jgi:hypothetical protein
LVGALQCLLILGYGNWKKEYDMAWTHDPLPLDSGPS